MLMLIFFIITAFMAGSSHCFMSIECFYLRELECQKYDLNETLSGKVEDAETICINVIPLGHCILGVMEKCAADENMIYDTEVQVEEFREQVRFIESACDEDSHIYKAIANNINCVMTTLRGMDDICIFGGLNDTTLEELFNMTKIEYQHCITATWIVYCLTARLDVECGSEVKYAFREILDNVEYTSLNCRDIKYELSYFGEAFEREFRQGKRGQEAVPGIMAEIAKKME